eukprot:m.184646 g.184646  ORF g.184646 m.184646 type:complete len:145 (+) comp15017_c0_seq1:161-595(+)
MDLIASDVGLNLTGCDELLGLDILGFGTMAKLAARRRRKRRMLIAILLDVDPAALEKLVTYEVNQQLLLMDLRGGSRPGRKKKKVPRHKKPCTWPELYLSGTYYDERQFRVCHTCLNTSGHEPFVNLMFIALFPVCRRSLRCQR